MHHDTHTKKYRGTGLYRNHSRRRGDKESHIRELIVKGEQEFRGENAELALTHFQTALALLEALHLPTDEAHQEQHRLKKTILARIDEIQAKL